jgi:hypothetical protein
MAVICLTAADGKCIYRPRAESSLASKPKPNALLKFISSGMVLLLIDPDSGTTNVKASALVRAKDRPVRGDVELYCCDQGTQAKLAEKAAVCSLADGESKGSTTATSATAPSLASLPDLSAAKIASIRTVTYSLWLSYLDAAAKTVNDVNTVFAVRFWWRDLGKDGQYPVILPRGVEDCVVVYSVPCPCIDEASVRVEVPVTRGHKAGVADEDRTQPAASTA